MQRDKDICLKINLLIANIRGLPQTVDCYSGMAAQKVHFYTFHGGANPLPSIAPRESLIIKSNSDSSIGELNFNLCEVDLT